MKNRQGLTIAALIVAIVGLSIGNSAFQNNSIISLNIPNSVTTIEGDAFSNNNLTSVIIGSGITSIGKDAFTGNSNLTSVTISAN